MQAEYIDPKAARRSFNQAAEHYDDSAELQREIADELLQRLDYIKLKPIQILDAGSGSGYCATHLKSRYPGTEIHALDFAENMLVTARHKNSASSYVCAGVENLPFKDKCIDLIVSSLTLQWCDDLTRALQEFSRVLAPGGLLLFTTFGPDTLQELRKAWQSVDAKVHVNQFADMHIIGDVMSQSGFQDVVMDVDRMNKPVKSVFDLMRDLKGIGAHNVLQGRQRGLTGKSRMMSLQKYYEEKRKNGLLPVSYEVVFAHAWGGQIPGHIAVPFDMPL